MKMMRTWQEVHNRLQGIQTAGTPGEFSPKIEMRPQGPVYFTGIIVLVYNGPAIALLGNISMALPPQQISLAFSG